MSGATQSFVDEKLKLWPVCVFSKTRDPECLRAREILEKYKEYMPYKTFEFVEIERRGDCESIENYLIRLSLNDTRIVPQIYLRGKYFGSLFELEHKHQSNELKALFEAV